MYSLYICWINDFWFLIIQAQIIENIKAPHSWPFVWVINQWPVNSLHKGPVMRKMFPFDDIITQRIILPEKNFATENFLELSIGAAVTGRQQ